MSVSISTSSSFSDGAVAPDDCGPSDLEGSSEGSDPAIRNQRYSPPPSPHSILSRSCGGSSPTRSSLTPPPSASMSRRSSSSSASSDTKCVRFAPSQTNLFHETFAKEVYDRSPIVPTPEEESLEIKSCKKGGSGGWRVCVERERAAKAAQKNKMGVDGVKIFADSAMAELAASPPTTNLPCPIDTLVNFATTKLSLYAATSPTSADDAGPDSPLSDPSPPISRTSSPVKSFGPACTESAPSTSPILADPSPILNATVAPPAEEDEDDELPPLVQDDSSGSESDEGLLNLTLSLDGAAMKIAGSDDDQDVPAADTTEPAQACVKKTHVSRGRREANKEPRIVGGSGNGEDEDEEEDEDTGKSRFGLCALGKWSRGEIYGECDVLGGF